MLSRVTKLPDKIYLVGIKGTGMSSLAVLLKKMGHYVTGSDTTEKFFTESQLVDNKIPYFEGFNESNLHKTKPELVIASTAYNDTHIEISTAKTLKIPIASYPETVGLISQKLSSVGICGSHGKTTTTSMLGWIMQTNSQTITLTGTVADQLNKKLRKPKFFIFEADEYQDKLCYYSPANVIITNIDYDHPDFFKTKAQYLESFSHFAKKTIRTGGKLLFNADDKLSRNMLKDKKGCMSYGFHPSADYRIMEISPDMQHCTIFHKNKKWLDISLGVHGRHNILNAVAAGIMASRLGITDSIIKKSLKNFTGIKRRLETIPNKKYIALDDYGHHPTEVRAVLAAVRNKYPNKNIVAVFHPHTLSRTKSLLKGFGRSFDDADIAVILDIYVPAREKDIKIKIHAKDLVAEIIKNGSKALYKPSRNDAALYIRKNIPKNSVILTIGAGDVWKMHELIK